MVRGERLDMEAAEVEEEGPVPTVMAAALEAAAGSTAIVAEDLGVFLPEVRALLEETG